MATNRYLALILTLLVLPGPALALSSADEHSLLYGSEYYWEGQTTISGDGGACLTLALPAINDPNSFAAAIDTYIKNTVSNSPLAGLGSDFVTAGQLYGINPAYVIAIAQKESSLGTQVPPGSYNSFGRMAATGQPSVTVAGTPWYKYASWADSANGESQYLQQEYLSQGLVTVDQVTNKYNPPDGKGNTPASTAAYEAQITSYMGSIIALAGNSVTCGGTGGNVVQVAQGELALHLVGTGPEDNGGPVCKYQGSGCAQAWCADFVSWVFNQAGTPFTGGADGGWRIAAAVGVEQWFQQNGVWTPNGPAAPPPQPGDVFYTPADGGHTGIIVAVSGNSVTTIEGNTAPYVASYTYNDYHTTDWVGWGSLK